jgi:hypothetical protein
MLFFWLGIAVVVVLLGVAGWTDLQARRRGRPITGIDHKARREAGRAAQTEIDMRGGRQGPYGGGSPF